VVTFVTFAERAACALSSVSLVVDLQPPRSGFFYGFTVGVNFEKTTSRLSGAKASASLLPADSQTGREFFQPRTPHKLVRRDVKSAKTCSALVWKNTLSRVHFIIQ